MKIKACSVPLITVDPYFSVWSPSDKLTDTYTCHWTGRRHSMFGMVRIDKKPYRFMGRMTPPDMLTFRYEPDALPQTDLDITPTASIYTFENDALKLTVTFRTPLLLDDPVLFSCPVSYIEYKAELKGEHDFSIYFDVSTELCADFQGVNIRYGKTENSLFCGNTVQKPLNRSGDDHRIDWGYLHVARKDAVPSNRRTRFNFYCGEPLNLPNIDAEYSVLDHTAIAVTSNDMSGVIPIAYDDVKSIQYFGKDLDPYYKTKYASFDEMLSCAVKEYDSIKRRCEAFDRELTERMLKVGEDYAAIGCLAYRQAIAAHKIVSSEDGLLFLSKENFSNGCIATLDVTYPSIPLFLLYNPELVKGMLRPIVRFARSDAWEYDFAPHDCGQYPLCNGQVYGLKDGKQQLSMQMPVEECANFILCVAAVCAAEKGNAFLNEVADVSKKWADYLVKNGYDPENQLCTDDFAGHLAHNCNLSAKAIVALGAYAKLTGESEYAECAEKMADRWSEDAKSAVSTRLVFDKEDGWSMKYNMVWDRLFDLKLFDNGIYENEIKTYSEKMNRYGVPLDSRSDYTKLDWMAWTTVLTDDADYRAAVYASIRRMIEETTDRVPITDWYYTSTARQRGFQNRSVLGGFFINLLVK